MSNLSKGKYAKFISDRSGMEFPYKEMVREWNGARVHISEFEPKQPQLEPTPHGADPQGLPEARPARIQLPTQDFLPDNPFSTINTSTVVTVSEPNSARQTGDIVRFYDVKQPVGGVTVSTLQPETTLAAAINDTTDTILVNDSSAFPAAGFIVIEKVNSDTKLYENEVIQYTGNTGNTFTGCTRGSNAPTRGNTPQNTTASSHSLGAKVLGAFSITMISSTVKNPNGMPATLTENNSYKVTVLSAATSTASGGGSLVSAGPIDNGVTE